MCAIVCFHIAYHCEATTWGLVLSQKHLVCVIVCFHIAYHCEATTWGLVLSQKHLVCAIVCFHIAYHCEDTTWGLVSSQKHLLCAIVCFHIAYHCEATTGGLVLGQKHLLWARFEIMSNMGEAFTFFHVCTEVSMYSIYKPQLENVDMERPVQAIICSFCGFLHTITDCEVECCRRCIRHGFDLFTLGMLLLEQFLLQSRTTLLYFALLRDRPLFFSTDRYRDF